MRLYSTLKMALKVNLIPSYLSPLLQFQTIGAKDAASLDADLMSVGAFSLDQLMELAGLSVSQARTDYAVQERSPSISPFLTAVQSIVSILQVLARGS